MAGPPGASDGGARSPTASRSPTPAWTGTRPSRCSSGLAAAVRGRRAASARMRIAVLGVGLIGGSIGLAAREHVAGRRGGRLRARPGAARSAPLELGAIDRAAGSLEEALDGAERVLRLRAGGRAARSRSGAALDAAGRGLRGHRRGLDQARRCWPRSTTRASSAATRSPAPRRAGVEHAARPTCSRAPSGTSRRASSSSGLLYERLHRLRDGVRRPAGGVDADTHDRLVAVFSHLPHVLANVLVSPGGRAPARPGRGAAPGGPELPRRDPRGGRQHGDLDRHLPGQPRGDRRARSTPLRRARSTTVARRCSRPASDVADWNDARPRRPAARCSRPDAGRRAGARAAPHRPEPPRYRRPGGARARQGRREHRGHGARAGSDMRSGAMTLWIAGDDAGRARRRADRASSASPWPSVSRDARFEPSRPAARATTRRPRTSRSRTAPRCSARCRDEPVTVRNYLDSAGHALDARRPAQPRRRRGGGRRRARADPRRGPARAARGHRRAARRGQLRHADAAAAGLARGAAAAAPGRSTATSRSGAARWTGSPSRCG